MLANLAQCITTGTIGFQAGTEKSATFDLKAAGRGKGRAMTDTHQTNEDDFGGAGLCCAVLLHNAPQIGDMLRKQAEDVFYEAIMQRFGSLDAAASSYYTWTQDKQSPDAQQWIAAQLEARGLAHRLLASAGGPAVRLDGDGCAHFEAVFIHDVD